MSNNLLIQMTRFIGRQREIVGLKRSLAVTRLLTLTGSGCSGKTRLAIELAASRVNMLTPQQIAGRLDDRIALLKSETRTGIHPRHQTSRAAIDWSYSLLSEDEQTLLRRMAVYEQGRTYRPI